MDDQVTLTAYADQVRELIRNDRNDEAIAICKHILRYYPKYVDAYRQLGEALLEKGQLDDAKELFRRVLSADPENVVAYAGLAVILEQEQLVAEAVWHMERAHELAPSNTELHKELHRLYHELDGRPRARLKLTSGALARVYIQAGWFAQAIQELNAIIAANAARFDARVALAETLWRVGQMRQAAEVAQALLETLPYCLKANLILGEVWKEIGLSESDQYLQCAQSLDPTNQTAQHLFGARSPLPPTPARVPRYIEGAPIPTALVAEAVAPVEPATAARPSEEPAQPIFESPRAKAPLSEIALKPPVLDTKLPPWLRTLAPEIVEEQTVPAQPAQSIAEIPVEPAPKLIQTEELPPEPAGETPGELPLWLAQLRQATESSAETPPAVPAEQAQEPETALPPWLRAESQAEETAPTVPSWIEEARSAETIAPLPTPAEETQHAETPALPSWIMEETRAAETALAQIAAQPSVEELPPWLGQPVPPSQATIPVEESAAAVPEPAPPTSSIAPVEPPVAAPKRKRPTRGDSHLVLARAYREANQMKEALAEYDYIVQKAPRLVSQVIDDLEVLSKRLDAPLEVHRILGDAYTRADRLAEALEEYRFVLEHAA